MTDAISPKMKVVVAITVTLSFISFWRAAGAPPRQPWVNQGSEGPARTLQPCQNEYRIPRRTTHPRDLSTGI